MERVLVELLAYLEVEQVHLLFSNREVMQDLVEHLIIHRLALNRKDTVVEELVTKMMVIMEQQMELLVQ